jgi:alkanesulfonate monooxygenase SsuD/methylene tetrahydromethanopterin reductase-like flavin-dependent oxidoreductase (luciferase family)
MTDLSLALGEPPISVIVVQMTAQRGGAGGRQHEVHLVQPDAVALSAGRFPGEEPSVWVDIDQKLFDPVKSHEVYNTYMDLLEYADTLGFDGVGVNEHHQNGYGIMPSPNIIAAGLARRTKDAAIVVLGNSIALYNPPVRVAEEFAMLDCISGGRLVAGFPVGTSMDTNYCYGQIPSLTREKYQEAHDLIIKAWTTREPFAFNGRITSCATSTSGPGRSSSRIRRCTFRAAGRWRPTTSASTIRTAIPTSASPATCGPGADERLLEAGRGAGRRQEPLPRGLRPDDTSGDTDEEAERLYSEHVSYFYNRCLHVYPGFADAPGYRTIKTIQTGALSQYAPPVGGYTQLTWKDLTEGGHVIAGSPETVRQRMEELIKGLNVGNIFCLMHVGNMPADKCMYSTKLFAEKVMPKLRDMFPDWETDNRFWTTPLDKRVSSGRLPKEAPTGAELAKTYAVEA